MNNDTSALKSRIVDDMKTAMRSRDQQRLNIIRFIMAAIKQREIDERITLNDTQVLSILEKLIKQHYDSIDQYKKANRPELVEKEQFELELLQSYMPKQLTEAEIDTLIQEALTSSGATSIRDMGKVMGLLKPKIQGRADMATVSAKIKAKLTELT